MAKMQPIKLPLRCILAFKALSAVAANLQDQENCTRGPALLQQMPTVESLQAPTDEDDPAPSLESLQKLDFMLDFQQTAQKICPEQLAACKKDVVCEEAMLDWDGINSELYDELLKCLSKNAPAESEREKLSMIGLQAGPDYLPLVPQKSFGVEVGIGAVGGVAGNLATAGLSTGVGMAWAGVAKIPGGESVAAVGQEITCMFGMGCAAEPSNSDVINKVEEQANRVIGEMGFMKAELKKDIADVKTHVTTMKDTIVGEMKSLGTKINGQFSKLTTELRKESQRILDSVSSVSALLVSTKNELRGLAIRHHFENKITQCNVPAGKIEARFSQWMLKLQISQGKVAQASYSGKAGRLQDAKAVMDEFFALPTQSESRIVEDMVLLMKCLTEGGSVFSRLAQHLQSTSMGPGEKVESMDALFGRYFSTFQQGDAVYMAKIMDTEFGGRRQHPDMSTVLVKVADVSMRRGQLYRSFWKAMHTDLISHNCPVCVRQQFSYWVGGGWGGWPSGGGGMKPP